MNALVRTFRILGSAMLLTAICASSAKAADVPVQVGLINLLGRGGPLRVTEDGKFLAAQVTNPDGGKEVEIFDTSDLSHPGLYARIPIEANGNMSLAADGKSLFIVEQLESQKFDKPGTYRITDYNAHDPQHPTQSWQQTLTGFHLALAPDASSYAYVSAAKEQSQKAELVVTKDGAQGGQIRFPLEPYSFTGGLRLSTHGDFAAYGSLSLIDLRPKTPVLFEQRGARDMLVAQECVITLFGDGQFIGANNRFSEYALFAATTDLPRLARIKHEKLTVGNSCSELVAQAGNTVLFGDENGWIYRLDRRGSRRLVLGKHWYWPDVKTNSTMDSAGHVFLAKVQNGKEVVAIYDLNKSEPVPVDWANLEANWHAALAIYGDKSLNDFERLWNALRKLEEGAPALAIDAPVEGISDKTAAAILNDYAFLLSKQSRAPEDKIDAAYRRAIALDPSRATAYLNFADHLQSELPERSDWDAKKTGITEAANGYRLYLKLGGKRTVAIDSFLRLADAPPEHDICQAIADYANTGQLKMLISEAATSVPMGERKVDLWFTDEGTAHVPVVYAVDSSTGIPFEIPADTIPGGDGLWGGDSLGLVVYRGEIHVLYYKDAHHPVESRALSGNQRCVFKTATVERLAPRSLVPELCKQLQGKNGPETVELHGPASMAQDEVAKRYGNWTQMVATGTLDVANDGNPIKIADFGLSSGAGAGCEEEFYDQVSHDGTEFASGPLREKLMELQHSIAEGRYPVSCGNRPRFFAYKGKIYFESKPAVWPPVDNRSQYHWVSRIIAGKVEDVCNFGFSTTISVQAAAGAKN